MEPFEKLEIILEGMINEKKKEVDRARSGGIHPAEPFIQGLEHELIGLQKGSFMMRVIKNNAFATSDEVIEKRYKAKSL